MSASQHGHVPADAHLLLQTVTDHPLAMTSPARASLGGVLLVAMHPLFSAALLLLCSLMVGSPGALVASLLLPVCWTGAAVWHHRRCCRHGLLGVLARAAGLTQQGCSQQLGSCQVARPQLAAAAAAQLEGCAVLALMPGRRLLLLGCVWFQEG
jgi:hypothetical protein